jgi:hypothetical protein
MKHFAVLRRLSAMQSPVHLDRPLRPVAATALLSGILVVLAMLLILVLLPAAIAAQAATI